MNTRSLVVLSLSLSMGVWSLGCRKRRSEPPAAPASEAPAPNTPAGSAAPAPAPAAIAPAMSAADQATMQKKFMSAGTPWTSKTPDQKRTAYYAWCQQYMFGDAAAKSRILAEIQKAGLSPEDIRDLKEQNRRLTFPPLPLQ